MSDEANASPPPANAATGGGGEDAPSGVGVRHSSRQRVIRDLSRETTSATRPKPEAAKKQELEAAKKRPVPVKKPAAAPVGMELEPSAAPA